MLHSTQQLSNRHPPQAARDASICAQVEMLSKDVDIIVHSTFHTVMGPDDDSKFLPAHLLPAKHRALHRGYRQTGGRETPGPAHLASPFKNVRQKPLKLPSGALTKEDDKSTAKSGASGGRSS